MECEAGWRVAWWETLHVRYLLCGAVTLISPQRHAWNFQTPQYFFRPLVVFLFTPKCPWQLATALPAQYYILVCLEEKHVFLLLGMGGGEVVSQSCVQTKRRRYWLDSERIVPLVLWYSYQSTYSDYDHCLLYFLTHRGLSFKRLGICSRILLISAQLPFKE